METGIHELTAGYALDALEPEEERAYEAHLAGCPQCQEDLASFWEVTEALATATAGPDPSPELRERILAGVRAERQNVVPIRRSRVQTSRILAAVAAAAAVAAIALGGWAVSLHNRLGRNATGYAQRIAVLSDPAARTVALAKGNGKVVADTAGHALLVVDLANRAAAGKTYELWVIPRATKTPQRAGLIPGGGRFVVPLPQTIGKGDVVAVTLEPAGGVDVPTGVTVAASRPL